MKYNMSIYFELKLIDLTSYYLIIIFTFITKPLNNLGLNMVYLFTLKK